MKLITYTDNAVDYLMSHPTVALFFWLAMGIIIGVGL